MSKSKLAKIALWKAISEFKFEHLVRDNSLEEMKLKFRHFSGLEVVKGLFMMDDYWFQKIFVRELAHRNKWKQAYAKRVVAEYKKFLYLYCVADGQVTPSVTIDKAWHLHLEYQQGYKYLEECVVLRPLAHVTDLADLKLNKAKEIAFFEEQYIRTLDLYIYEFNQSPPNDIWKSVIEEEDVQSTFKKRDRSDNSYTPSVLEHRERQKEAVRFYRLHDDEPIYYQLDVDAGGGIDPFSHDVLNPVNDDTTNDDGEGDNDGNGSSDSDGDCDSTGGDSGESSCGGGSCGGGD